MENFLAKLKEYLQMETEISYQEFSEYYNDLMEFLQHDFDGLDKDDSIKGRYIMKILLLNAGERSRRKNTYAKKFKKISEKTKLWADAFNYRLLKMGLTQAEIDASHETYNQEA